MYKHITPNTIYYYSHTFSLVIYTFSVMYTAWCLFLKRNINSWMSRLDNTKYYLLGHGDFYFYTIVYGSHV